MNLKCNPSTNQLAALLGACDDKAAHHILWVSRSGDVNVTPLPYTLSPVGFERSIPDLLMRYETFQCGNDYVGAAAAADEEWVSRLFASLTARWAEHAGANRTFYIDFF